MNDMYQTKLQKNQNGYDIIIYIKEDSEFAQEFEQNDTNKNKNHYYNLYQSIIDRYPKFLINSVKLMIGGVLLATIPFNTLQAKASTNTISSQQVENQTYTTQAGDSLWKIANQYNTSVNSLKQANNLTSDILQVGIKLIIPTQNLSTFQTTLDYTVKSGDSLWSIAKVYNVSVDSIKQTNNLTTDRLSIGQHLNIPQVITTNEMTNTTSYTVKAGDNLSVIANRYDITIDQLRSANRLTTDTLQIGQVLQIPDSVTAEPVETITTSYTVKAGDSLSVIANRYEVTVNQLRVTNNLTSDFIRVGQTLEIPEPTATNSPVIDESTNVEPGVSQTVNYVVQPGDSLSVIASRYGVTVNHLRETNSLTSDVIRVGQTLEIPQTTTTPAPVIDEPINVQQPEVTQTVTYVVQYGDSLSVIANRYDVTVNQLRESNNLTSDLIRVGQTLEIPQTTTTPVLEVSEPIHVQPEVTQTVNYVVQPGDSLYIIANQHKVTVDALRTANNLTTNTLQIGQVLVIPQEITQTPSPVINDPIEEFPDVQTVNYTVEPGDSLYIIANKHNITIDALKTANNLTTDTIFVGQTLAIPQMNITGDIIDTTITTPETTEVRDLLYKVKTGDTVESIAYQHNISPERIMEANNLAGDNIILNQALILPLASDTLFQERSINPITYTVQSGDTLWELAKSHAVSIDTIRETNNLQTDNLDIGQNLVIPTTISITENNINSLEWLVEAQYNMTPTSVFHDVTVQNQEYWAKATREQITYYATPDNFVDNPIEKYQFLVLNYHQEMNETHLNTLLENKGVFDGMGAAFNKAAADYNVSQVYLVAHAMLETGNGTTPLARGILVTEVDGKPVTPKVVYNMYGINAFDINPDKHGAEFAYKQQWFTVEDAIIGGAEWISNNYINHPVHQQNTLYKMRWNPSSPGIHQYSTDVAWAYHQTFNIARLLAPFPNIEFEYEIPTFNEYIPV